MTTAATLLLAAQQALAQTPTNSQPATSGHLDVSYGSNIVSPGDLLLRSRACSYNNRAVEIPLTNRSCCYRALHLLHYPAQWHLHDRARGPLHLRQQLQRHISPSRAGTGAMPHYEVTLATDRSDAESQWKLCCIDDGDSRVWYVYLSFDLFFFPLPYTGSPANDLSRRPNATTERHPTHLHLLPLPPTLQLHAPSLRRWTQSHRSSS